MKYFKLLPFLFFVSCHNNNLYKPSIRIENKELKTIVQSYFDFLSRHKKETRTITIDCEIHEDSIIFNIVNSVPDLSLAQFNGVKIDSNYTVCFIGEMPSNLFLTIEKNKEAVPDYIINQNRIENSRNRDLVKIVEPVLWSLYFKNNKLVQYIPMKDINSLMPELGK